MFRSTYYNVSYEEYEETKVANNLNSDPCVNKVYVLIQSNYSNHYENQIEYRQKINYWLIFLAGNELFKFRFFWRIIFFRLRRQRSHWFCLLDGLVFLNDRKNVPVFLFVSPILVGMQQIDHILKLELVFILKILLDFVLPNEFKLLERNTLFGYLLRGVVL